MQTLKPCNKIISISTLEIFNWESPFRFLMELSPLYLLLIKHVTIEISILLICFCSFHLFRPSLDKDVSIENLYIALSCPIK